MNDFQFPEIVDELAVESPADKLIVCMADICMRMMNDKDFVPVDTRAYFPQS